MLFTHRNINLGAGRPQNDNTIAMVLLLEVLDVFTRLFHQFPTCGLGLYVRTFDVLAVVVIENGCHRMDRLQLVFNLVDVFFA